MKANTAFDQVWREAVQFKYGQVLVDTRWVPLDSNWETGVFHMDHNNRVDYGECVEAWHCNTLKEAEEQHKAIVEKWKAY